MIKQFKLICKNSNSDFLNQLYYLPQILKIIKEGIDTMMLPIKIIFQFRSGVAINMKNIKRTQIVKIIF